MNISGDRGLKDKIIVITGGCGDIGGATAKKLSCFGARVIVWDLLNPQEGKARAKDVGAIDYMRVDQGDARQVRRAVNWMAKAFGRLDVAIGNAAHAGPGGLLECTAKDWEESLRVNVIGSAMLAQASVRVMLGQDPDSEGVRGKVLFTSSWIGRYPWPGCIDYCVSKAAIDHLVRVTAQEFASQGIRVNCVSPGIVNAGMSRQAMENEPEAVINMRLAAIPMEELGTADQVADAFVFLASRESNYMTGHNLFVDGGCALTKRE